MEKVLLLVFLASRVFFMNPGNVFFDSKEYLTRWAEPSLWTAITSGHTPLHNGYILTFWPVFQVSSLFTRTPEYIVILFQVLLSAGIMIFFYRAVTVLFSKPVALKASVILALSPLFWITNGTVMMETTYLFYWIGAVYFLLEYLTKKRGRKNLILAGAFWAMAFWTHTVVILWIPLILYLMWMMDKRKFRRVALMGGWSLLIASMVNAWLLGVARGQGWWTGFYDLYLSKFGEHAEITDGVTTFLRYFRNWLVPMFYNYNGLLIVLAILGFFYLVNRKKKMAVLFFLWLAPTLMANQWWDSLFYGRHSLIAVFALTILASLAAKRWWYLLLVMYLGFCSTSSLSLLRKESPYQSMLPEINKLAPGGLLIESHFARPQTNTEYFGEIFFVGEPGYDESALPQKIDDFLKLGKPVFVTGQALSEPYGLFNGPYPHSLTLSYKQTSLLYDLSQKYSFDQIAKVEESSNLTIYQVQDRPGHYPTSPRLSNSVRRLDHRDVISKMVLGLFIVEKAR